MGIPTESVPGAYVERADAPVGALDRLVFGLSWLLHRIFRRQLTDPVPFASAVGAHAARLTDATDLPARLPDLRYRLRRDGLRDELIAECFGMACAALARSGQPVPGAATLGAARAMTGGSLVDHADADGRLLALTLAAAVFAARGTPVHLLALSESRARRIADSLEPPLSLLGIRVGLVKAGMAPGVLAETLGLPVVCGAHREIATAYLQDRLSIAGKPRLILGAFESGTSRAGGRPPRLLSGLHCALVDDADVVMLDDAFAPVTITTDADHGPQKLLYEQSFELARACVAGRDFTLDGGPQLTPEGAGRLERLVAPLGGVWAGAQRREELVCAALDALHLRRSGEHYRVEQGRVVFPRPPLGEEQEAQPDPVLRMLIELKEGCRITAAREVLTRISVPRFYRRYLHLAGVCADARGVETEFRDMYGLKVTRAGAPSEPVDCHARVFVDASRRRAVLLETVAARSQAAAVLVAARTPAEAQAVIDALAEAGQRPGRLRGTLDDNERAALASLDRPNGVAVTLFPGYRLVPREAATASPLHLIVAELHDASRHVSLLHRAFGASSCELLLSLEEEEGIPGRSRKLAAGIARARRTESGELPSAAARWIANLAQREIERERALMRRDIVLRDQHLRDLLAFSGHRE